jgi:hypothetical protein
MSDNEIMQACVIVGVGYIDDQVVSEQPDDHVMLVAWPTMRRARAAAHGAEESVPSGQEVSQ